MSRVLRMQRWIGNQATQKLLQRQPEAPAEAEMTFGPMLIASKAFQARARARNSHYAQLLGSEGWPYLPELKRLWQQGAFDGFAEAVWDYQVNELGVPAESKQADGILGRSTAGAMKRLRQAEPTAEDSDAAPDRTPQDEDRDSPAAEVDTGEVTDSPGTDTGPQAANTDIRAILDPVRTRYAEYVELDVKSRFTYAPLLKYDKTIAKERWDVERGDWALRKPERDLEKTNQEIQTLEQRLKGKLSSKRKRQYTRDLERAKNKVTALEKQIEQNKQTRQEKAVAPPEPAAVEAKAELTTAEDTRADKGKDSLEKYQALKAKRLPAEQNLIQAIAVAREQIAALGDDTLKAQAYKELNTYTVYHYQIENADILYDLNTKRSGADPAGLRTCNITVLAMVLQGLGKTAKDYQGGSYDKQRFAAIASAFSGELKDRGENPATMTGLSLPNFLQLVAIDIYLSGDPTDRNEVAKARDDAEENIVMVGLLLNILDRFGASSTRKTHDKQDVLSTFGAITSSVGNRSKHETKNRKGEYEAQSRNFAAQESLAQYSEAVGGVYHSILQRLGQITAQVNSGSLDTATLDTLQAATITEIEAVVPALEQGLEQSGLARNKRKERVQSAKGQVNKLRKTLEDKFKAFKRAAPGVGDPQKQSKLLEDIQQYRQSIEGSDTLQNLDVYRNAGNFEDMQKVLSVEDYKADFVPAVQAALDSGNQVVVNLFNHYVRLQSLEQDGFIIDDPATAGGGERKVSWAEGIADGYFRSYTIVKPK